MILYPAIDIMDGHAVRLVQGRFEHGVLFGHFERVIAGLDRYAVGHGEGGSGQ